MTDISALKANLHGIKVEDDPRIVRKKSRDFFWFSPVLKEQLDGVTGDLLVSPKNVDEAIRVLKACYAADIPVTARGAGTGNYGQAMPLSGGVVLDLSEMDAVMDINSGVVVAEPGAVMADIDAQTISRTGHALRIHPSTYRIATIGGFLASGAAGVGSVNWGGLRDLGNVIRLRMVTMEPEPKVLELTGSDVQKVLHAYGTTGIITEIEVPLTEAYDWVDVLVGFDDFINAIRFSEELANMDGLLTKNITAIEAPLPYDYFLRHKKFIRKEQSVVVAMGALDGLLSRSSGAGMLYRSDRATAEDIAHLPPAYEFAWNHTTLRGLSVDPSITYLQVRYPDVNPLETVSKLQGIFAEELQDHLEFIRYNGRLVPIGLPIVCFTDKARLDEIIKRHEALGCTIFNPHRYTLEEGVMKQIDPVLLAFKRQTDPKGLLNPGKMIAWDHPDYRFDSDQGFLFPGLQRS
ncbi:FAD-binding oxidoreductase [uncultured Microbulbifer sp.]|uniref:FAD-binding oxidoreductase n=1 Tax=uncultured Microbulbifer sp. TaxID=348147 RepID=UPI00261F015B|nr:FAD-binding oxidoreductase [uncultured Microbulbifer sp.]